MPAPPGARAVQEDGIAKGHRHQSSARSFDQATLEIMSPPPIQRDAVTLRWRGRRRWPELNRGPPRKTPELAAVAPIAATCQVRSAHVGRRMTADREVMSWQPTCTRRPAGTDRSVSAPRPGGATTARGARPVGSSLRAVRCQYLANRAEGYWQRLSQSRHRDRRRRRPNPRASGRRQESDAHSRPGDRRCG
jgi:hypothetical protein